MLNVCLPNAVLCELATGTHLLQVGSAASYTIPQDSGDLVEVLMGLWTSGSKWRYHHDFTENFKNVILNVSLEEGMELVARPDPWHNTQGLHINPVLAGEVGHRLHCILPEGTPRPSVLACSSSPAIPDRPRTLVFQ